MTRLLRSLAFTSLLTGCLAGGGEGSGVCGDGVHQESFGEACDDGNTSDFDACTTDCKVNTCGDGLPNRENEECDDGNNDDADACLRDCQNARCGDGILRQDLQAGQPGYEGCDDGNLDDSDACLECVPARCGDGVVRSGVESCDDGNETDNDDCRNDCSEARCGDGVLRADRIEGEAGFEACDDGNRADSDACLTNCTEAACGDGVRREDLAKHSCRVIRLLGVFVDLQTNVLVIVISTEDRRSEFRSAIGLTESATPPGRLPAGGLGA